MKITIISIGKFENSPHRLTFEHYLKRMKWAIELKELELKNAHNLSIEQIKDGEAKLILKALKPSSIAIALDEKGREFTSQNFAKMLENFALNGNSHINFIIGGANGLSKDILQHCQSRISLGLMTFPHLMVRSIILEQIYRAWSINSGHPYHKE